MGGVFKVGGAKTFAEAKIGSYRGPCVNETKNEVELHSRV